MKKVKLARHSSKEFLAAGMSRLIWNKIGRRKFSCGGRAAGYSAGSPPEGDSRTSARKRPPPGNGGRETERHFNPWTPLDAPHAPLVESSPREKPRARTRGDDELIKTK